MLQLRDGVLVRFLLMVIKLLSQNLVLLEDLLVVLAVERVFQVLVLVLQKLKLGLEVLLLLNNHSLIVFLEPIEDIFQFQC